MAQRIGRYADIVGRERVIAGVDCGFGTSVRTDPMVADSIVWAKLCARSARAPKSRASGCGSRRRRRSEEAPDPKRRGTGRANPTYWLYEPTPLVKFQDDCAILPPMKLTDLVIPALTVIASIFWNLASSPVWIATFCDEKLWDEKAAAYTENFAALHEMNPLV